jgi:hypothetical protein
MWNGTALGPDIANRIVDPTEMRRCPSRVEKRIAFLTLTDPNKIGPGAAVAELDCKNVSDFFAAVPEHTETGAIVCKGATDVSQRGVVIRITGLLTNHSAGEAVLANPQVERRRPPTKIQSQA